ncbi:MAG: hypothetical protein KBC35_02960 [Candidatus Pacebacteria bacterium]|nr:hypothetical protein [Candidatus Paceibacterota bacterium]
MTWNQFKGQSITKNILMVSITILLLTFAIPTAFADQWRVESRDISGGVEGELLWEENYHGAKMSKATGVATDASGVYVVGDQYNHGGFEWRVEKRSLSGDTLMWERIHVREGGFAFPQGVAVDASGMYVVGFELNGMVESWRIEKRSLTDGSILWEKTEDLSDSTDKAYSVAVDSSGLYIVGHDANNAGHDAQWHIEKRSLTDGAILWDQTSNPSNFDDFAYDVAVDSSGLYVVGVDSEFVDHQWRIEKRNLSDGELLWKETFNPTDGYDYPQGVTVNSSGVYIAGNVVPSASMDSQWRVEMRSSSDGHLIWGETSNPSSGLDKLHDITIKDWVLYLVGSEQVFSDSKWRIESRSPTSGYLFWSKVVDPSSGEDEAQAVAVYEDKIFAVGYDNAPRPCQGGELLTWEVDGKMCSGYTSETVVDSNSTVTDAESPVVGAAVFKCDVDSQWSSAPNPGATCSILPDLTAVSNTPVADAILSPTEPITFTGAVRNSDDAAIVDGGLAVLEIEWEDGPFKSYAAYTDRLGNFLPGETKLLLHTIAAFEAPNGTHRYRFRVDADSTGVVESDETNNTSSWVTFTVAEPALSGSSCIIPIGENSCLGYISWLIAGAVEPNIYNSTTNVVCQEAAIGSGQPCSLSHGATNGLNLIQARDANDVLRDITVSAECSEDAIWSITDDACAPRPPSPGIEMEVDRKITRQGGRVTVEVTIDDPVNDLVCAVYGVDPDIHPGLGTFVHQPSTSPVTTKTFTTKELKAAQIIQVVCTETAYEIKTTKNIRVEVTPTIKEL